MAAVNTKMPLTNTADGYLCQGTDIKGSYFVIDKLDNISERITEKGSLCYCQEDSKVYQYNGETWVGAEFGSDIPLEKGIADHSIQQSDTGAKALGNRTVALNAATAGCKGYRYCAIDTTAKKIYLTANNDIVNTDIVVIDTTPDGEVQGTANQTITPDDSIDITKHYAKNDKFTLKMRGYDVDNIGTIVEIHPNYVVYDDAFASELERIRILASQKSTPKTLTQELTTADTYIDRYSFSVPTKPANGVFVVSEDAFAAGTSKTAAVGRYSVAMGRDSKSVGDAGVALGRNNTAGYQAFAAGEDSVAAERNIAIGAGLKNYGIQSFAAGAFNTIGSDGVYGFVAGSGNTVNHKGSAIIGRHNGTLAEDQFITGIYAANYETLAFAVGNGVEGKRSNAIMVWKDGHATLGAHPDGKNGKDIATVSYAENYAKTFADANSESYFNKYWTPKVNALNLPPIYAVPNLQKSVASKGCTVTAHTAFALGESTIARGQYALAAGRSCEANETGSIALGFFSQANRAQAVVGLFNTPIDGPNSTDDYTNGNNSAVFIVGNGKNYALKSDGTRGRVTSNAFVVYTDGRVAGGRSTTVNDEALALTTKDYVDALKSRIEVLEAQLEGLTTTLNQLNDGGIN